MIMDFIISVLDIAFLASLLLVIKFYTQGHDAVLPKSTSLVFAKYPMLFISIFFCLFSVKNFIAFLVYQKQTSFIYEVASRLSKNNLENYLDGEFSAYINIDSSVQTRKISQQPIEFAYYILGGFQQMVNQLSLIFITVISIILFNPFLFLMLFIILMPPVLIVAWVQKKKLNTLRKNAEEIKQKSIQHLQEALMGFVESNLYQRKNFFVQRFFSSQKMFNDFLSKQQILQNLPSRFIEVFAIFGLFILILLNETTSHANSLQLITLGAFMAAAYKIIPGIVKVVNVVGQIKTYEFTIKNLKRERQKYVEFVDSNKNTLHSLEFSNVCFSFQQKRIFKNFSFHLSKGDFAGISGVSGKGKTTLVNLLLGFLEPDSGTIFINKEPASAKNYWNRISYVKQQPFFIHDTVIQNVVLHNDCDEEQFEMATKLSGFKTFINGRAAKKITENGKNISGGQRQRIILARALYKDFDLLILDEPFSELDEISELQMMQNLKELASKGKIILLITHNKSCLQHCNKIIELDAE